MRTGLANRDVGKVSEHTREQILEWFRQGQSINHIVFLLNYEQCIDVVSQIIRASVSAPSRYFLGSDGSGHQYIVPVDKREQWDLWTDLDEDNPASWHVPDYATRVDGRLTFTDPRTNED